MIIEAIIQIGSKQYFIVPNKYIITDKINLLIGNIYICKKILMINDLHNNIIKFGYPYIDKYIVQLLIIKHFKNKKIKIIKFKRRKHYKKQLGHKQIYTKLLVNNIIKI